MNYNGCKRKFDVDAFARKYTAQKRKLEFREEEPAPKKTKK